MSDMTSELARENFLRMAEDDRSLALVTDFSQQSDRMLISFGGIKGFRVIPPFEFFNLTQALPAKKIFVRDFSQSWYQAGLPGLADSVEGIAAYLREQIKAQGTKRLVLLGNSMGGYAALLFGALLDADVVLAFAPQTYLGLGRRLQTGDLRWFKQLRRAEKNCKTPLFLDLRAFLGSLPPRRGSYHLYYSRNEIWDYFHARHLRGTFVQLHESRGSGHRLVRDLRDSGQLQQILVEALREVEPFRHSE